jgi:hypothetical protein
MGKVLQANTQLNRSSPHMSFKINPKNIIMMTLEEVLGDARKAFKAHHKAAEKRRNVEEAWELQGFLQCFKKDQQGNIMQIKKVVPSSSSTATEVVHNVITPPSSVFLNYNKHMTNKLDYMLVDGLAKIFKRLSISPDPSSVLGMNHGLSSSAPHVSLENTQYGMPKNFTLSQVPLAMSTLPPKLETTMVLCPPMMEPLDSIRSSATTS